MELIEKIEQDGYIIEKYINGAVVKYPIPVEIEEEKPETEEPTYTEQQVFQAQVISDLSYIKCLTELNSMKGV